MRAEEISIDETMDDRQVSAAVENILAAEPLSSMLAKNSSAAFYIFFSRRDRVNQERTAFLTSRGGARGVDTKKSRPILLTSTGEIISPKSLIDLGWKMETLYEARNPVNAAQIEKLLHQRTLYLPLGRRLHRNYCGGAKWSKDSVHMVFGVYVIYNDEGYAPFMLQP